MPTRRNFLLGAAAGVVAFPSVARSQGILTQALAALKRVSNGSFFDSGRTNKQAVTILASNAPYKTTTLAGLAGASPSAFFTFVYRALLEPVNTMPVIVVTDPSIGDVFRVEIWPDQVVKYWDMGGKRFVYGSFGSPLLRTFFAAMVGGTYQYINYITVLPRFAAGVQGMIRLFYNYNGPPAPIGGAAPLNGFGNFAVLHNNLGDGAMINVQGTYYGDFNYTGPAIGNSNLLPINWGHTLGAQPDFHVGADPRVLSADYAFHGILTGINLVTGPNIPAPIDTVWLINPDTGEFRPLPPGGFGAFGVSPVNLNGPPNYAGIGYNFGPDFLIPGTNTYIDTTFGVPIGQSDPSFPPPGTDILYEVPP